MIPSRADTRAIVLAPTRRDAQVTLQLIAKTGITGTACDTAQSLESELETAADLLITTDDVSKRPDLMVVLTRVLRAQPSWSELPVIVVAKEDRRTLEVMRTLPGALLIERPVQIRTFETTVHAAMAARQRQYLIRDQIEEIRRVNEELSQTATFAQQLMAVVSHDLRNPLAAIQNGSQLLMRSTDPSAVQRIAPMLKRSAERANSLISDLLDFSQARLGGGIPIHAKPMDFNELLTDAVSTMARSDPNRCIEIMQCPSFGGRGDHERLHQALINVLVNALKHSPAQSTVELSGEATSENLTIAVTNLNRAGPIPDAIRRTLFEPFKRFAVTGVDHKGSFGLGLYIVDQIVRAHGGHVEVESNDTSTTFRLIVPRVEPMETSASGS